MHGEYNDRGGQGGQPGKRDDDGDDDPRRSLINLAGLVFVILLVVGCVWLARALSEHAKLEDCLMSGRTNCAPIDTSQH